VNALPEEKKPLVVEVGGKEFITEAGAIALHSLRMDAETARDNSRELDPHKEIWIERLATAVKNGKPPERTRPRRDPRKAGSRRRTRPR